MSKERLKIAEIVGVHGIRGLLKLRLFLEEPALMRQFSAYYDTEGKKLPLTLRGAHKQHWLAEMAQVTTREAAEALRGTAIYADKSELPEIATEDDFYYSDLMGLEIVTEDGQIYGTVRQVMNYGAGDILEINPASGGQSELYPFTRSIFPEIDLSEGRITFRKPKIDEVKGK